jgi:two-component sensor histidine kinase
MLFPLTQEPQLSVSARIAVSAADGTIMALLVLIAWVASRKFPIGPNRWLSHIVVHVTVAFIAAGTWILALLVVFARWTGTPLASPFQSAYLGWLTTNVFAYFLLVAVLHALAFQHRLRRRELQAARLQAQLTTARLETLKSQLNPHFLFNTLHTISELIHLDPAAADRMVNSLARLLRVSLDFATRAEVRLSREAELVSAYLELQQMRHADRLAFQVRVAAGVADALVPPMLLQPIVENSIRHGISPRSRGGLVSIDARADGLNLRLTVEDDGVGVPPFASEGVGLSNTRNRLTEAFGLGHRFEVSGRGSGGVRVVIEIPLKLE